MNVDHPNAIRELAELRADLDHVLAGSEAQTLFLDQDLKIRKFSPRLAEAFALTLSDLGKPADDFLRQLDDAKLADDLRQALHAPILIEKQVQDRRGSWYRLRINPYSVGNATQGVVLNVLDIDALKRAEQQVRDTLSQRDRFLSLLSHELRNPLGAILNALYVTRSAEPRSPAAVEAYQIIERRGWHMARLLEELLDISRLTQNKIALRKQTFDLGSTMEEVLEEVRPHLAPQHIELSITPAEVPLMVEGDTKRLQQVQVNLLMNAIKYTPPEGRIDFRMAREVDSAVIRVRDNGVGIHPMMLEKVFDLFVQGANAGDRSQGGMGVGLTLVRAIVELHGGQVKALSDGLGKGSEFVVRLPLAGAGQPQPAPNKVPTLPGQKSATPKAVGRRILIVEDDMDIRETLRSLLKMEGHQISAAPDGIAALALLEQQTPEVALLDIGLPGIDGYELARRIRAKQLPIYLVAMTGYGQPSDRDAAHEAGFDAHLTKPVKPIDLFQVLATLKPHTPSS